MSYDLAELEALWILHGGNPADAPEAASIAMAESGGNPNAANRNSNGTTDRGLWQINSSHGALSTTNVAANVKAAIQISGNGKNWSPWTTYTSGAYSKYIPAARGLLSSVRSDIHGLKPSSNANSGLGIPGLDQLAGVATSGLNTASSAVSSIPDAISGAVSSLVSDAKYAGLFIAMLLLGALMIFHGASGGGSGGKTRMVPVPV